MIIKIIQNNLKPSNHCVGTLQIGAGPVNLELCDYQPGDCFLCASRAVNDESITEDCSRIFPYIIEDNMFPITLTYKAVDGFSNPLNEFHIYFKYAMINITENEPTGTKPGHFVNDTQKGITSIPLSTTIEDLKTPNGFDENCNTKDNPTLIIVLATLLGLAVPLVIILTLRLFRKLAYYRQIVSTTSKILRTPKPELQNENEIRQENEVQQENEMQQGSEVRHENDEAQEENNPDNIEDMYSVVNKKEKTSKNEKEMVDNVLYNM
uniref:uncharacterized protein LOC120326446 n=1 Tax=Styela clava TaxID=7725 RepID=UPI00193A4C91|nr:uncharacterized protein LOC120326446 [Styela clava]XP_039248685.1 uncharacterized protein LOC120326446 [Styela clava]